MLLIYTFNRSLHIVPYVISGSYERLFSILLSQFGPLNADTLTTYLDMINKDIPRTPFFLAQSKAVLEKKLHDTSADYLSYIQGNFTGAVFSAIHPYFAKYPPAIKKSAGNWHRHVDFVYIDDGDNLCGFSLAFLTDEHSNIGEWLNICIIKNVVASPKDRETTFIQNEKLLEKSENFEIIATKNTYQAIKRKINSQTIFNAIEPLFHFNYTSLLFLMEMQCLGKFSIHYCSSNFSKINLLLHCGFLDCINLLNSKVLNLKSRGFHDEADILIALHTQLCLHKNDFIHGRIDSAAFKEQCILSAKCIALEKINSHRNWLGKFINNILQILNFISGGYIPTNATDSMIKITNTQLSLFKIPEEIQKNDNTLYGSSPL